MWTSNRLFGNISMIQMATAQSPIFRLLRIYHFPTANIAIISLLQIEQLIQHCKSSKYLFTVHWKILWQLQIAYFQIFRRFIWQLRKAQFCGHCASIIFLLHISQLYMYCKSTNYFTTGNRLHNCLLCIEKFCGNFKSPIWKHINDLYGYYAKHNFLANCASIILLMRISQLFIYCKSTNYFNTGNRLNIWLLYIEKLYDNFSLPISIHSTIYMASAQSSIFGLLRNFDFATENLQINYELQIDKLFHDWKSST